MKDISSLSQYVQTNYLNSKVVKGQAAKLDPINHENGIAEFNTCKRKIIWHLKNVKGQQTKNLDIALSYEPGIILNELHFKQLGPFDVDFDIPNHTASTIKIVKMDVKVSNDFIFTPSWNSLGGQDPNSE